MSTPEIKPALTAEEWAEVLGSPDPAHEHIYGHPDDKPHRMAALCLHGQPFGFTHEDVRDLEDAASRVEYEDHMQAPLAARLDDLAARIAALLPPDPAENA